MTISYEKLWNFIEKRGLNPNTLKDEVKLTSNAITKMQSGEAVTLEVLAKICGTLGCQLDDIVEIHSNVVPYTLIPDVDFDFFTDSASRQYSNLGLSCLYDLHIRITHSSVLNFLISNYQSWSLSLEACKELLAALAEEDIYLDFPENIELDPNVLPHDVPAYCEDEDDPRADLFQQKIENYLDWYLRRIYDNPERKKHLIEELNAIKITSKPVIIEDGVLTGSSGSFSFKGIQQYFESGVNIYPMNLIHTLWGGNNDYYVFHAHLDDLREVVENIVKDFSVVEQVVLMLREKYTLSSKEFADILDIPAWESILWYYNHSNAYQRAIRKLAKIRHPRIFHRLCRIFAPCDKVYTDALRINPCQKRLSTVYYSFIERLKLDLAEGLTAKKTLTDALSPWYPQKVIEAIEANKPAWFCYPEISLEDLELSWRVHYALSHAGVLNLNQILEKHGRQTPLTDFEHTGLMDIRVLGRTEIVAILDLLSVHMDGPLEPSLAETIIDYAETQISDECDLEMPPVCLANSVVRSLLEMGYRNLKDILSDYRNGTLLEQVEGLQATDKQMEVLDAIREFECGEFPLRHYSFNSYWESVLKDNPEMSLQNLRDAYVQELPFKRKLKEFEENISTLFPEQSWQFMLLFNTRNGHMPWFHVSAQIIEPIFNRFVSPGMDENIKSLYVGFIQKSDDENAQYETWFLAQYGSMKEQAVFLKLAEDGHLCCYACDGSLAESLVEAIQFMSNINDDPERRTDQWENCYAYAQIYIRRLYMSDSEILVSQYYTSYVPVSIAGDQNGLQFLTIDEFDLSIRSFNCLKRADIHTVADLVARSDEDMMKVRNMGKKSLDEVCKKLKLLGLKLRDE